MQDIKIFCKIPKLFYLVQNIIIMATKKPLGRPKKKDADKVKVVSAYLTKSEEKKVLKHYHTITAAIRIEVLPKCG